LILAANHTTELQQVLFDAAQTQSILSADQDDFGWRFMINFALQGPKGTPPDCSSWIIWVNEGFSLLIAADAKSTQNREES